MNCLGIQKEEWLVLLLNSDGMKQHPQVKYHLIKFIDTYNLGFEKTKADNV